MVHLTRIYTRTGDAGTTRLVDNSVVAKTSPRIAAYGAVDELNSTIGLVLLHPLDDDLIARLGVIQQELFDLGSDLATPLADDETPALRITEPSITRLEGWCDDLTASLGPLDSFILPGGTAAAAHLHLARTTCRRAERLAWAAVEADSPAAYNPAALMYLNRLSDFLFLAARQANGAEGDVLWVPGGSRPT
ncbi:MAG: cob(I)yrinic acid a,c-diamide adenosyltransferase [Propionibacteriaceae bacterium]|jgi:cob(I)alamin adenosyltransferase|nr:cob(I)yrinic acid a,c-diamide adenosyltransferase [Propionibacteriaceae bacterium]